jgi:hypothetical protein
MFGYDLVLWNGCCALIECNSYFGRIKISVFADKNKFNSGHTGKIFRIMNPQEQAFGRPPPVCNRILFNFLLRG